MAHLCIVRGHMRTVFIANRAAVCGATAALLVGLGGCRTRPPHINPPAGIYACPAEVSITAKHHHAKIFFTTDDSAPTKLSPKYTGPQQTGVPLQTRGAILAPPWTRSRSWNAR